MLIPLNLACVLIDLWMHSYSIKLIRKQTIRYTIKFLPRVTSSTPFLNYLIYIVSSICKFLQQYECRNQSDLANMTQTIRAFLICHDTTPGAIYLQSHDTPQTKNSHTTTHFTRVKSPKKSCFQDPLAKNVTISKTCFHYLNDIYAHYNYATWSLWHKIHTSHTTPYKTTLSHIMRGKDASFH